MRPGSQKQFWRGPVLVTGFLPDCVNARPAVAWLTQVWGAVTKQLAPPLPSFLIELLADGNCGWLVKLLVVPALQLLWTRLRLTTLLHLAHALQYGVLNARAQPPTAAQRVSQPDGRVSCIYVTV